MFFFDRLINYYESRICALMGVDPMVCGLGSGTMQKTYANLGEALNDFWERQIVPMLRRHASTLTAQLFPSFGMEANEWRLSFDTSEVAALQENVDALFTRWRELWQAGGIDLYTLQTKIGLPGVPQEYKERFVGDKPDNSHPDDSEEVKDLRQWYRAKTSPESNSGSFAPLPSGPFASGNGEMSDLVTHYNAEKHLHQLLDANAELTHTNRLAYRETLSRILANMPPAAHKAILKSVKTIKAFNNISDLRARRTGNTRKGTKNVGCLQSFVWTLSD